MLPGTKVYQCVLGLLEATRKTPNPRSVWPLRRLRAFLPALNLAGDLFLRIKG